MPMQRQCVTTGVIQFDSMENAQVSRRQYRDWLLRRDLHCPASPCRRSETLQGSHQSLSCLAVLGTFCLLPPDQYAARLKRAFPSRSVSVHNNTALLLLIYRPLLWYQCTVRVSWARLESHVWGHPHQEMVMVLTSCVQKTVG